MKQSQITYESGGKTIRLDCFLPDNCTQRLPTVIGLYGFGGNSSSMGNSSGELADRGFAVYVLHFFDRTGRVEAEKSAIVMNFPLWMKTLWDGVSCVEKQSNVDPQRIGLVGFSLGGYLAMCGSSIDPRIKAVVEFFGGFPKEMRLFMRRLCPTLILHGENDNIIPVSEAYYLQKLLDDKGIPHEIKIYPDAGHGFEGDALHDARVRSLAFLRKYLANGVPR